MGRKCKKTTHLQDLANQLSDSFNDLKIVTKSHVPVINVQTQIEISNLNDVARTSKAHLKHDRPMGSKEKNLQKKKQHKR